MRELLARNTGVNLKNIFVQILAEFNISIAQVYSITTDNGADIVNGVKRLVQDARQPCLALPILLPRFQTALLAKPAKITMKVLILKMKVLF